MPITRRILSGVTAGAMWAGWCVRPQSTATIATIATAPGAAAVDNGPAIAPP
ncbi:hypothetical protein [Streptomyces sp. NPDC093260]|uniref:hypothetical protein n=1 Tax=Streptomyces sp. NPDC093260 TaxID=3155073 RepID=UPI00341B5504